MSNTPTFKHKRPTIGILAGWSIPEGSRPDQYRGLLVQGIQSAARSRGCHILLSWGIRRIFEIDQYYSCWPDVSPKTDFVPVGPWNTDGLIVLAPLGNEKQSLYLQGLIATGFPVLFIASGEDGPSISVNNKLGIHQAVTHLMEHGHRRIAFLGGRPADKGDSEARLQAYNAAVTEYNLDADPNLVTWGWFDFTEGYKSTRDLLHSDVPFTALVASNDASATGAMQAIREAGLKIPGDIAIIGFDDQPGVIAQVPPLASIHVPLSPMGEQAVLLMMDHLQGLGPLESIEFSPRLVKRQSCGCIPVALLSGASESPSDRTAPVRGSPKQDPRQIQQQIVTQMLTALPSELRFPAGDQIGQTCSIIVDAFYTCLKKGDPIDFQTALLGSIHDLEMADASIDFWQEMISILRREMLRLPGLWRQGKTRQLAEDMLHQARALIGESAQRQDPRHQYLQDLAAQNLNSVTARLSVALSDTQVVEFLNTNLPGIGIRHARLMFFEGEQGDPVAWSVAPGLLADGSLDKRFRSRDFPPPDLYPEDELLNLILLPLVFQNEVLGYAAFDASDIAACVVIARQLAATIKVSRLHAQVVELSLTDPLTGLYNRRYLDIFLTNEIARGHRSSHKVSVIMLDIDHFKEYNDRFGHPAGDQALREVAERLTIGRRTTDVVTRIGGEEFAIILPETDVTGALRCAEKIRTAVEAISDLHRPITISLGIAMFNDEIYKPETFIQHADRALYEAKKAGRNRTCIYEKSIAGE